MAASAADVDSHDGQNDGLQTAKDLFSGAVGGIAQVLIGEFRPKSLIDVWQIGLGIKYSASQIF